MDNPHNHLYRVNVFQLLSPLKLYAFTMMLMLIMVFICSQKYSKVIASETTSNKIEVLENKNETETNDLVSDISSGEISYDVNYPEISAMAKTLIVTVHAPWLFKSKE